MCGLYGIAGDLAFGDKDIVKELGWLSMFRGVDSSGLAIVGNKGGDPSIIKTIGRATELHDTVAFDRLSLYDKKMVLGHARHKTIGEISRLSAHPYNYDHITGVHNGTLTRYDHLPSGKEITDSATIFRSFAEIGVRDTIEQIAGAYALVWYDSKADTLNFLRNDKRPLFYGMTATGDKLLWASESWMIHLVAGRNNVTLANLADKGKPEITVDQFPVDNHFKVRVEKEGAKNRFTFLNDEVEIIEGDVKKPVPAAPFQGSSQPYRWRSPWDWEDDANNPESAESAEGQRLLTPPGTTKTADASTSTKSRTDSSGSTASTSKTSRSPRSLLTLVPTNKSDGSGKSTEPTSEHPLTPDDFDDPITGLFDNEIFDSTGNSMVKADWVRNKVNETCQWCSQSITFEDALEHLNGASHIPGVGRWLDNQTFLCTTCNP